MKHDWFAIIISFIVLFFAGGLIMVFAWGVARIDCNKKTDPQSIIDTRYDHCQMVWGDSEYFEPCMRGLTITPQSGRM